MPAADILADALRSTIEPWAKLPDDVLWDIAEAEGVRQVARVRNAQGDTLWTDAPAAQLVLAVRGLIRACTHHP